MSESSTTPPGSVPRFVLVTVKPKLTTEDFGKLVDKCVPFDDGRMWKSSKGADGQWSTEFRVHPAHTPAVGSILKKYGVKLNVLDRVELEGELKPGKKKRMHVSISLDVTQSVFLVKENKTVKKVTFHAVDTLFSIVRERKSLTPRSVWWHLARVHKLFPEIDGLQALVVAADIPESRKTQLKQFLERTVTNNFEGMRRSGKDADTLTYYNLYWYVLLILDRCGLVKETGNREVFITPKGAETEDWLPVAEKVFVNVGENNGTSQ